MIAAIAAYFIIVDFPASKSNKFLTEDERAFVQARLIEDRGAEDEHVNINAAVVLRTAMDWKIWSFSMMYFAGARYDAQPLLVGAGTLTQSTAASTLSPSSSQSSSAKV
jgi:hypothetical protein